MSPLTTKEKPHSPGSTVKSATVTWDPGGSLGLAGLAPMTMAFLVDLNKCVSYALTNLMLSHLWPVKPFQKCELFMIRQFLVVQFPSMAQAQVTRKLENNHHRCGM
jgi:hypothetical protein